MKKSILTGTTEGVFDSLKVRVPPYTGNLVDVGAGGGGGGASYNDTELRGLIQTNVYSLQLKADATSVYDKTETYSQDETDDALLLKQDLIQDNDLTPAKTSGLVHSLGNLQAQILNVGLTRYTKDQTDVLLSAKATTSALAAGLGTKQNSILDGDLTIAKTNLLQQSLDSKATNSALNAGLNGKQNLLTFIDSGDVSHTSVTTIDVEGGTVSGTTLTIPAMAGPQGIQGIQGIPCNDGNDGRDGGIGLQGPP